MLTEVRIKSKKSVGTVPVYDICVPGPHHYILESGVVSHNSGFIYASSIVVAMRKLKLKEDSDGNKTSEVHGIRSACKVMKTRYSKPFESIKIDIPWETGMNPYSGLFDLFEKSGSLVKEGNKYRYTSKATGEVFKFFRKEWNQPENMEIIMREFSQDDLMAVDPNADEPTPDTAIDAISEETENKDD